MIRVHQPKPLLCALLLGSLLSAAPVRAQSGVLLPLNATQPDPSVLSLDEMDVNVAIDDNDARVYITQIFTNHTKNTQEGTYIFALPSGSTVSDFATWDGPVRIPAVILERRRAEQLYNDAHWQAIDPGLLQAGERDGSNPAESSTFTAVITPIPAYATKRLELEYHQKLRVDNLLANFLLPLQPAQFRQQTAAQLRIHFQLHSSLPFDNFQVTGRSFPLHITQQDPHTVTGSWQGSNVALAEDFTASWKLDSSSAGKLFVSTFRNPYPPLPSPGEPAPPPPQDLPRSSSLHRSGPTQPQPGFFLAQTLIAPLPVAVSPTPAAPRNVVLLLDTSLSMQWDKLERSFAALQSVLLSLTPADRFSLILFNQDITAFQPAPVPATPQAVQQALQFVQSSRLRGGTDLLKALTAGLAQASSPNSSLYLFTDGGSDRGITIVNHKIATSFTALWQRSGRPRLNIFAVGDDANLPLLRLLAQNYGLLENVLSTEPIQPKLTAFLAHSVSSPVADAALDVSPNHSIQTIYPLNDAVYPGSVAAWIGDYTTPTQITFTTRPPQASETIDLPSQSLDHPQLPRLWAQARVNALLAEIARNGETRAAIEEIISLSRRYKFVTPYTSFLAVPRALLRPRIIRPGDPVLRIHSDTSIISVIALFPFGLTQPLRHLPTEDTHDHLWQTRFLAPTNMQDGTYTVRLILRDLKGNTYSERKSFVIASTPPSVRIHLEHTRFHRGEIMSIRAGATASTRTLTARLQGAVPVDLRWNSTVAADTGDMRIPDTLAPGSYILSVTAEDIAHNVGSQEVQIEVVP